MTDKVSWDRGAPYEAVVEAVRRVFVRDGIPRHVYEDGKIMKYDWKLAGPEELLDSPTCISYEDYIRGLIQEAENDGQGR